MKTFLTALFLCLFSNLIFSQVLPNYSTQEELDNMKNYVRPLSKGITNPPLGPVRNPAEWEEMQAICISWAGYEDFMSEIVRYAREEALVYIYCIDSNDVKSILTGNGISTQNTKYIQSSQGLNSVWIRDFGANCIYRNAVDSLYLVDWVYNRARPRDDTSPAVLATRLNLPLYECTEAPTDLVATGGNFMSDGFNTAISSELIVDENATVTSFNSTPKSVQDIKDIVHDFLGIETYILMETLPYDGIHHMDMHMKLLDEETLLVGEYPAGISDGPQIETNIQNILNNFTTVFGTPFKIVRIPMPPSTSGSWPSNGAYYRTYTNSLIINKTVLVPTYYEEYDTTALRIYREAMPGYRVIGIDANAIISASGTIHCTTHEIAVHNPLLISHQELENTNNISTDYEVNAYINHKTGISWAKVWYTTDTTQAYTSMNMTLTDAVNFTWTGYIPVQTSGTTVYYYIEAQAVSGKTINRPMPAPDAYWDFYIYNPNGCQEISALGFDVYTSSLNAANQRLIIKSGFDIDCSMELMTITGQTVKTLYTGTWPEGNNYLDFDRSGLSGIYFIRICSDKGTRNLKVVLP